MERRMTRSVSRDSNLSQIQKVLRERNNTSSSVGSTPKQNSPILKPKGSSKNILTFWKSDNLPIPKISNWMEIEEENFDIGSSICDRTIYPYNPNVKENTSGNILDESFYEEVYSPVACGELFLDDAISEQFSDLNPNKSSRESSGLTLASQNDIFDEEDDLLDNINKVLIYKETEMSSSLPKQTSRNLNKKLKPKHSMPDMKSPSCPTLRSHTKKSQQKSNHVKLT